MEIVGSFLDEEWESLSQIFSSSSETPDFLLHCDASTLFSTNLQIPSPTFSPSDPNISQESSEIDEALFLNIQGNHQHHINTFDSININDDGFMLPVFPDDVMEEFLRLKPENRASHHSPQEMMPKTKSEAPPFEDKSEDFSPHENPKKKPRNAYKSRAAQSKKSKKTIQEKKNINEEEGNKVSCSSYSSEDESNAKTRATRGSATDPQSLYARKRRERINERLKILQNLVPNGTKVDISTMLEEAVHYVKFLQLQIKLLSSDNLWMYAPLAYNGMDIGIYQNISPDLRP